MFKGIAMKAVIVSLALVGLGIGIYASVGRANPPKQDETKKAEEPKATAKRVDALGDQILAEGGTGPTAFAAATAGGGVVDRDAVSEHRFIRHGPR